MPPYKDPDVSMATDLHAMEKLWAKELYELSRKERETINNELHGVLLSDMYTNPEREWSEEQYCFYFDAFQNEIDTNITFADKQSYLKGLELGSSYILSNDFRMGFIRTERYNIENATRRYCRCLDFLLEYFGKGALMRPLLMSDLTKKEAKFLREGYVQILPSRDRLGRRILAQLGSYGGRQYTELEKFRVNIYLCFAVLSVDITTQRLGAVSLASFTRGAEEAMREEARTISKLMKQFFAAIPLRWSAAHLCIPDDPLFRILKALVIFFLGLNGRKMLRIHTGTPLECDYTLRSFGIPTDDIPRTYTHTIKVKNHNRFIKVRKSVDAFVENAFASNEVAFMRFPGIECPEVNCVLFGRYAWDHPGNIEFRGLLRETFIGKERHVDLSDRMHSIVKDVIDESLSRKFRFLMYDRKTFLYKEVTEYGEVWGLTEQALKEYRKRSKAKRVIDEAKFEFERDMNKFVDVENADVSLVSSAGQQRNNCGKFMKDCNGHRRYAFE
mmetsp:Transcript_9316/g.23169  ORF Transcript_9316/g.23169 Transcript_9316/m.23169 type:complete len:501 (+) Transcript_9316:122-1624(+)